MTYDDLDTDAQIDVLTDVARLACAQFDLDESTLALVLHEYNTTFSADDARGRRFALRVNTNSKSTPAHIAAQQAWLHAITQQTSVVVPDSLRTTTGEWFATIDNDVWGGPVRVSAASWVTGEVVDELSVEQARQLGEAMARLHEQASSWQVPEGADLPVLDDPLFTDDDHLHSVDLTVFGAEADRARAVIDESFVRAQAAFDHVHSTQSQFALHADLHRGNLLFDAARPTPGVIDVDDMGLGVPTLDLAISAFYLRRPDGAAEARWEGVLEGYAAIRPVPECDASDFEALVASRQLLLANALFDSSTASHRAAAVEYLRTSVDRLGRWLETARFAL